MFRVLKVMPRSTSGKAQHTTPCRQCPFRRTALPGWLGGSEPEDFCAMAQSEVRMPCHRSLRDGVDYSVAHLPGKPEYPAPQCAGRAIFWSNQFKAQRPGSNLLVLPADHQSVFSSSQEFLSHHERRSSTGKTSG
jgi:hypothetical protein